MRFCRCDWLRRELALPPKSQSRSWRWREMEWNDRSKKAQKRLGGKFIPITLIQGEVKGQFLCNCGQKEWPSLVSVRLEETINRGMGGWERRERERPGLGSADRTQRVPETLVTLSRQKAEGCRRHGGQALWALLVARWAQRTNSHSQWRGGGGAPWGCGRCGLASEGRVGR